MAFCIAAAVLFISISGVVARQCPLLLARDDAMKTGSYITMLKPETSHERMMEIVGEAQHMCDDSRLYGMVERLAKAFTMRLSKTALNALCEMPEIEYIEEETMATGDQSTTPWYLDRLQMRFPRDGEYQPIGNGSGVDIYILDTGINYNHTEFEGRALYSGYDPADNYYDMQLHGEDCHGHGTHVSSIAAGMTYGVAKGARIYSVRVFNCTSSTPWSVIMDGIEHASLVIPQRGRPSVVSMSFGGDVLQSANTIVENLIAQGISVVVSAGNHKIDACLRTPASAPSVITVGGSSIGDGLYTETNYGSCVDIFAPGSSILGADYTCQNCSRFLSGTSFATPMVSGVVAIHLERNGSLTPPEVKARLINDATVNSLNFNSIPSSFRMATPNRLLYIDGSCGGSFTASADSYGSIQTPNYPSVYSSNVFCRWTITAPSGYLVRLSFTNFDTRAGQDIVKVCNGDRCFKANIAQLSGSPTISDLNYVSSGASLSVEFQTGSLTGEKGFRAIYTAIKCFCCDSATCIYSGIFPT